MKALQPTIIQTTNDYIFVNKPSGLLTILDRHDPTAPSVVGYLRTKFDDVYTVHRIDKDTSGCLVFAKNAEAHRHASMLFENRQVNKYYTAIVLGNPPAASGEIRDRLTDHPVIKGKMIVHAKNGKEAITKYQVIDSFKGYSVINFKIETGRMHQIRVHCANMGCPIVCDPIYGQDKGILVSELNRKYKTSKLVELEQPILNRLALHSHNISFNGLKNELLDIEAPLYKDMSATIDQMKKWLR
jgi:23S rRNA pseudouridine1911/1915/1917 synthase